ncbi:FecR domain-containing protein [Desulfococcaceae bacterium HSG8]|nr:FecR domain-containing protein [Desulfococcaceae bacterium HSG8]
MKSVYIWCAILTFILIESGFCNLHVYAETMQPVGYIHEISGTIAIENKNIPSRRYEISAKNAPFQLYRGDTVDTMDGKAGCTLNDKTGLTLSPGTKLVIDRHIFDSEQKIRSSFIDMISGTARFVVEKLMGWNSEFKVRTELVIAGAEGSDFVLNHVRYACTMVLAFEDTHLNVQPIYEEKSVSLNPLQYIEVCKGQESVKKNVPQEEMEQLKTLLPLFPAYASRSGLDKMENYRIFVPGDELAEPPNPDTQDEESNFAAGDELAEPDSIRDEVINREDNDDTMPKPPAKPKP